MSASDLEIVRDDALAPLAFIVRITRRGAARAAVGSMVPIGDGWLCDGAWGGPLGPGRFDRAPLFGTGVRADGAGRILVVGSATAHERSIVMRVGGDLLVANSLPLLLAAVDDELDPSDLGYRNRYLAMELGLDIAGRSHRTRRGRRFELITGDTVTIERDGSLRRRPHPRTAPHRDYASYRSHLLSVTESVFENANDVGRPHRFEPICTLSAGFDSVAAAAVASACGARLGFTLVRPRADGTGERDDDARPVAEALGLELHDVDRRCWRDRTDLPEADHAASLGTMGGVVMIAAEAEEAGRLVVSGLMGDVLWSTSNHRVHRTFVHTGGTMSGRSSCEARLRVGSLALPVPGIGADAHRSIVGITRSDDLAPWRLGGTYDRPIPRRLGEEAGVPREAFGQRKFAGSARVGNRPGVLRLASYEAAAADLLEVMTPTAAESFLDFVKSLRPPLVDHRPVHDLGAAVYQKLDAASARSARALAGTGIPGLVPRRVLAAVARRSRLPHSYTDLLPHWGTSVLAERYHPAAQAFVERTGGPVGCAD